MHVNLSLMVRMCEWTRRCARWVWDNHFVFTLFKCEHRSEEMIISLNTWDQKEKSIIRWSLLRRPVIIEPARSSRLSPRPRRKKKEIHSRSGPAAHERAFGAGASSLFTLCCFLCSFTCLSYPIWYGLGSALGFCRWIHAEDGGVGRGGWSRWLWPQK